MDMEDSSEQKCTVACNRRPFLSDSGCDRGDVDVNQFADFPYCDPISPDKPEIPPELMDSPLYLPVPPPCACINIKHKIDFKYSTQKKFEASASFSADGDCCEGNYNTNLNLQIPCPINKKDDNAGRIRVKIDYGNGDQSDSASFLKADASSCTIEPLAPEINLNLPCPVTNKKNPTIKATVKYGNSGSSGARKDINLDLRIPCPVKGEKKPKVKASIKYGSGGNSLSASYASADSKNCTVNLKDINLDLQLPCPVANKKNPKIKATVRYGSSGDSESESYASADKDINLDLRIPCPVKGEKKPKVKASIKYGSGGNSALADYASADSQGCTIGLKTASLNLQIPCPVKKKDNAEAGHPKIRIRFMKSSTESSCMSSSYVEIDSSMCEARFKTIEFDLRSMTGGGGGGTVGDGPFYPEYDGSSSSSPDVRALKACYWQYGGITFKMGDQTMLHGSGFLCIRACATPDKIGQASIQLYADMAKLNEAQRDPQYFVIPIYYVMNGRISLDMRRMPIVFATEVM